jgi:hypothetical protein
MASRQQQAERQSCFSRPASAADYREPNRYAAIHPLRRHYRELDIIYVRY